MSQKEGEVPLLVRPREAAAMLAVCEKTLYSLTKSGSLKATRIGRSVRYSIDDLRQFVAEQKNHAA